MIRLVGEPDNAPTVTLTQAAFAHLRKPQLRTPKTVVVAVLALCAFAWYENTLLVKSEPCKPSASSHCSPVFHDGVCFDGPFDPAKIPPVVPQSRIWIEPLTIGGVGLPACPSNKKCV